MLFDFSEISVNNRYKLLTATVVPRPIAWVVTEDAEGTANAAPFSFFNVFSSDPPVLGISIGGSEGGANQKDTLRNILASGQFVVCLVPESAAEAMNVTAIDMPPGVDELREAGLTPLPSARVRPPRIGESPVAMECETFQTVPLGGNTLVLGRILAMHLHDECVLDAARVHVDTPRLGLIGRMHGGGGYLRTTDQFQVPRISWAAWRERQGG